jgi:hypothetical protein
MKVGNRYLYTNRVSGKRAERSIDKVLFLARYAQFFLLQFPYAERTAYVTVQITRGPSPQPHTGYTLRFKPDFTAHLMVWWINCMKHD